MSLRFAENYKTKAFDSFGYRLHSLDEIKTFGDFIALLPSTNPSENSRFRAFVTARFSPNGRGKASPITLFSPDLETEVASEDARTQRLITLDLQPPSHYLTGSIDSEGDYAQGLYVEHSGVMRPEIYAQFSLNETHLINGIYRITNPLFIQTARELFKSAKV